MGTAVVSGKAKEATSEDDTDEDSRLREAKTAAQQKNKVLPAKQWQKTQVRKARKVFAQKKKEELAKRKAATQRRWGGGHRTLLRDHHMVFAIVLPTPSPESR